MKTSPAGRNAIQQFEGLRLTAYDDGGGTLTIGYGHTGGIFPGQVITQAEALAFFEKDMGTVEAELNRPGIVFTQNQFDALASWTYNLGIGRFRNKLLPIIQQYGPGSYKVPARMVQFNTINGIPSAGLTNRRLTEAAVYTSASMPWYVYASGAALLLIILILWIFKD